MAIGFNIRLPAAENTPMFHAVKKLSRPVKSLADKDVILLDKDEFLHAFNETVQLLSIEEIGRIRNYIFSQLNEHHKKQGPTCSFRDWLTQHNLSDVFFVNELTQNQRYKGPMHRAKNAEHKIHELEHSIVLRSGASHHKNHPEIDLDFLRENGASVDEATKASEDIKKRQLAVAERKKAQETIGGFQFGPQPGFNTTFMTGNDIEPGSDMVNMYYGLHKTPLYCRKKPGTYIFRYRSPELEKWSDKYNDRGYFAEREFEALGYSFEHTPSATTDEAGYFEYCGYVPRHVKEHSGRLVDISGRVVHIILAILTFCDRHGTAASPGLLAEIVAHRECITARDIVTIHWYWKFYFPRGETFPESIQMAVRESPVVAEFFSLLTMRHAPTPREAPHLRLMLELLKEAAGWKAEDFVDKEDERQATIAFAALRAANRDATCLIFTDSVLKNIHEFYGRRAYDNDPYHPRFLYQSTPELHKKLEEHSKLLDTLYKAGTVHEQRPVVPPEDDAGQGPSKQPTCQTTTTLPPPQGTKRARTSPRLLANGSQTAQSPLPDNGASSLPTPVATPTESSSSDIEESIEQSIEQSPVQSEPPAKRGRGRPPGSKNKKKTA